MADSKKKKSGYISDNAVEQLTELGKSVASEVVDVPKSILDTAFEQIGLKPQRRPLSGEINVSAPAQTETTPKGESADEKKVHQLTYLQKQEKEVYSLKQKALQEQIQRLMNELALEVKRLETQTAQLSQQARQIAVETVPANAGTYHLGFFEFVIASLRDLRKRVNESRLWLDMWSQKKKQKNYWGMFKKHGTGFAMSEERAVASSAG